MFPGKKYLISTAAIFLVLISFRVNSQDTLLTIQQALEIALKNNYDIQIAGNRTQQSLNNNSAGNAGMLPDINASGSYTRSSYELKQEYSSGLDVERDASVSTSTLGDLGARWTIFDGLKMFYTKSKLSEEAIQSGVQLKIQIENTLQQVISSYYIIVRQQQLLKAMREELQLSEERVTIAQRRLSNGSGSRLDWLQLKTEFNRQQAAEIKLESESDSAKLYLNYLLSRNPSTQFNIEDTVIINYRPAFEDLKKSIAEKNNFLKYYMLNEKIAGLVLYEYKSSRWPVIDLNAHYIYSKNTNEAGFTLLNRNQGFNYGVTATVPLFRGLNINRQIKNSKLDVINSKLEYNAASETINRELMNAWREFSNNLQLLQLEEENINYAREVLFISQERYKIGLSNVLEQHESQRIFEEAMIRLADARYNAKISETILKRLNGELVQ